MSTLTSITHFLSHWILRYLPVLQWLPKYQLSWLRADIIAGVTVWAVMVPEAMAYSGKELA